MLVLIATPGGAMSKGLEEQMSLAKKGLALPSTSKQYPLHTPRPRCKGQRGRRRDVLSRVVVVGPLTSADFTPGPAAVCL